MSIFGDTVLVILQTQTNTSDGQGGFTNVWNNTETVKCLLHPMEKDESNLYDKNTSLPMFACWMNGKKDDRTVRTITTSQRILFGTRIFNILFVANQFESNNILKLALREETNVN